MTCYDDTRGPFFIVYSQCFKFQGQSNEWRSNGLNYIGMEGNTDLTRFEIDEMKRLHKFSSFEFRVSSFKFQVSSSKFQVSSFKFRVSSFKFQVSSFKLWCDIISYDMISYLMIWYDIISYLIISYRKIWYHIARHDILS
jgi:hypothetical protein